VIETRRLIGGLRPPVLDESGVVAAIENLVYEAREPGGPKIEFASDVQFDRLEPTLENAVFRIVQECLTNACRYSKSERIVVCLGQKNGHLCIEVRDWGAGFDPRAVRGPHYGLRGIRERARLLGGRAVIRSAPGKGTRVLVELPLVGPASEPAQPPPSGELPSRPQE
jgi:signal transduction histidine kinase